MRLTAITLSTLLLLTACGNNTNSTNRPYVMGTQQQAKNTKSLNAEIEIATIQANTQKEVAQIQKERDLAVERMKQEAKAEEVKALKEIEIKKQEMIGTQEANLHSRYNTVVIIGSLFLLSALGMLVYFFFKRREDNLKIHRDRLEHERSLKEKELQVQMATKILDTLASGQLEKEDEKRLIETFERSTKALPKH